MSKSTIAAILLAGALLLATGHFYAQNRALTNQVRELTELVQRLTDARDADASAYAERSKRLREINDNAQIKLDRLDEAAAGAADDDAAFLDALRGVFSPAIPHK